PASKLLSRPHPSPRSYSPFPYTTLFRSLQLVQRQESLDQGADKAALQPTKLSPPHFHLTRQGCALLTQWPSSSCGRSRDDLVLRSNAHTSERLSRSHRV